MNKNSGALLRDIRNIKRNNTVTLSMTAKEIHTSKNIKQTRSSEQINLKGFMEKNQKIKDIDERLQLHQGEIERNNIIIDELTNTLEKLRDQLSQERVKLESEQKKSKGLREQLQRTNKMLKGKNCRIDEISKKLDNSEKEAEANKAIAIKFQDLTKANAVLRKQIVHLQELALSRKEAAIQKEKQIQGLKIRINDLSVIKGEYQKVKAQCTQRQQQMANLNGYLASLEDQNKYSKIVSQEQIQNLNCKMREVEQKLRQTERRLTQSTSNQLKMKTKLNEIEEKNRRLLSEVEFKSAYEKSLKGELEGLKKKVQELGESQKNRQSEEKQKQNKINAMKSKLEELKKKLDHQCREGQKLRGFGEKVTSLQKKSKELSDLYKSIIPQIQCPYGHELKDAVTIIPCGHNYCQGCKKGYQKECMMCHGKLKIEAVYRNELMDEIIEMIYAIKQILDFLK